MHKSVSNLPKMCAQTTVLFTSQKSQHKICVNPMTFNTLFTSSIPNFYTAIFSFFNQLFESYTRFTQALLLKLQLYKLIEG